MKKLAVLLVCMLFGLKCLIANPIAFPSIDINEIMFDAEKGWMLELHCLGGTIVSFVKLTVSSTSGSAESNYFPVFEEEMESKLFVLTRDSMKSHLDINPLGDKITVIIALDFFDGELSYYETSFVFGNIPYSQVHAPFEGQSIVYAGHDLEWSRLYAKTNNPTMGEYNDISKIYGTLTGKVYDKNKQLVLNDSISLSHYYYFDPYMHIKYVKIDKNGSYSGNVLANCFSREFVYMANKKIQIIPIKIDVEPDSIIEQDIYLLEDYVNIDEVTIINNSPVRIYPNPLSVGAELQYEVGVPVKSLDCRMELITMDGHVILERKITDNIGAINLPQSLPNGAYIVNFRFNNKTHYSTRLIIGQ